MRRAMLLVAVIVAALWPPVSLWAGSTERMPGQERPGDTTLVDETFRIAPGADLGRCFAVSEMTQLTVIVSSPEGRTGETATFNFRDNRQTASPNVLLGIVQVPAEDVISTHLAPAGSYCYYLIVTHNLTSALPDDASEKPYKQVHLKIISTPYNP